MSILSKVYKAAGWYWGATRPPNPPRINKQPARNERGWSLIQSRAVTALHPHRFCIF